MGNILVADDEHAICTAFRTIIEQAGHQCVIAATGQDAIQRASAGTFDAIFLDVRLPDMNGLDVLQHIQAQDGDVPVVVMTGHGTVDTAMQAMRSGAFDYLGKPVELHQIRDLLTRALRSRGEQGDAGPADVAGDELELIGTSAVMQEVFKMMSLLSGNDLTVLIAGESGVGKEMVARGIHQHSERASAPFMAVNCAAIPAELIESELFGHERGAFSGAHTTRIGRFEAAEAGTIFLDEVFELPPELQSKLLRVLQEKSFEKVGSVTPVPLAARIIAATNRPVHAMSSGIREDLYHRLSLVNLNIPALRERLEDIPALANYFLAQANRDLNKQLTGFAEDALARLTSYAWPGNVRELDHTIKRSALTASGPVLNALDLKFELSPSQDTVSPDSGLESAAQRALRQMLALHPDAASGGRVFHQLIARVEGAVLQEALKQTQGNQVAAAQLLGINRTTLRNKISKPDTGGDE